MTAREPQLILVSACLLGICVRYDGSGQPQSGLIELAAQGQMIPVCPEVAGGLPVPRPPAEIVGGDGNDVLAGHARVLTRAGQDLTQAFVAGARVVLTIARRLRVRQAVLAERSPSCGCRQIYDGSFRGQLIAGSGVTAALLARYRIKVQSSADFAG